MLYALKGGGKRAFYRWLVRDWHAWFPRLPAHTRLFRLFAAHADWTDRFRAAPPPLSRGQAEVVDSYGIELIHPPRSSCLRTIASQREPIFYSPLSSSSSRLNCCFSLLVSLSKVLSASGSMCKTCTH